MPDGNARRSTSPAHLVSKASTPSILGDAYDIALMETINGLTAERIRTIVFHDGPLKMIADVCFTAAGVVDW